MRLLLSLFTFAAIAAPQSSPPLRLRKTIPLPDVQGRIDHMSLDVNNGRLFVAALGNNTIEVIDIEKGERIHTIPNLREPQGVLYLPDNNRLYSRMARTERCGSSMAFPISLLKPSSSG